MKDYKIPKLLPPLLSLISSEPPAADDQDSADAKVPAPEEEPRLYQGPEQANMSDPQLKQLKAQKMAYIMLACHQALPPHIIKAVQASGVSGPPALYS